MHMRFILLLFILAMAAGNASAALPDTDPAAEGIFATNLTVDDFDSETFAELENGVEKKIVPGSAGRKRGRPQATIYVAPEANHFKPLIFGDSPRPGKRYLRVGFTEAKTVGSLLVIGDVGVSVLKPDAPYPGTLDDDTQWHPAKRVARGAITSDEQPDPHAMYLWVLPPDTQTRALRFTHTAARTDRAYRGTLAGAYLLPRRLANLAPQATVFTRSRPEKSNRIIDNSTNGFWKVWDNIKAVSGERAYAIEKDSEWVVLSWPHPVDLDGLAFQFPGFGAVDIQTYTGPEGSSPRDASERDWKTLRQVSGLADRYPYALSMVRNWVPFDTHLRTRAIRLRITAPLDGRRVHPHMTKRLNGGKRVWLGEVMAVAALEDTPLQNTLMQTTPSRSGIPVRFTLPEPGFVTLVIEDGNGTRVRNLVSDTYFPRGTNTVRWDGSDDLGRDREAAKQGRYSLPNRPVPPGRYTVHGLRHQKIEPFYEFSVYNAGTPPWSTDDHTGGWLGNHSPPQAALFLPHAHSPIGRPAVVLGCFVTEGLDGIGYFDLDGKKHGGRYRLGGRWTAAPYLARDEGGHAVPGVQYYAGAAWWGDKQRKSAEIRVSAVSDGGETTVARLTMDRKGLRLRDFLDGLAVRDKKVFCSIKPLDTVLVIDAVSGKQKASLSVPSPRGLAFESDGKLLVLSGQALLRLDLVANTRETVIAHGLESPEGITLGRQGDIYISDHGNSHQVKVFSKQGAFLRAIGRPGAPKPGVYDPLHMNHPYGMAIDSKQQLWVTEMDNLPRRTSVWSLDGCLLKAFYGPPKYGGGGTIDAHDKSRYYYANEEGTLGFRLDWEKGTWTPDEVLARKDCTDFTLPKRSNYPETPIALRHGSAAGTAPVRYFTNAFNNHPTHGSKTALLFIARDHVLHPAAAMGMGSAWSSLFSLPAFADVLPAGIHVKNARKKRDFFFIWSDLDGDGTVQPAEVQTQIDSGTGVTVQNDLSFTIARLKDTLRGSVDAVKFSPVRFTEEGVPVYALERKQRLASGVKPPASSGGDQALTDGAGNAVLILAATPYDRLSVSGTFNGKAAWSYPNLWPGLHASHHAPTPTFPGELIGTTRLLGNLFTVPGSEAGALFALNGNMGNVFLFTSDGLFVTTLFSDNRVGKNWRMPTAVRGMALEGLSLIGENFWPTITRTPEGNVYLGSGKSASIVRLDGLASIRRIAPFTVDVAAASTPHPGSPSDTAAPSPESRVKSTTLKVPLNRFVPAVDGSTDEWPDHWAVIAPRGHRALGAVTVANGTLYAAWKTGNRSLLENSGELPMAPFKTGGSLDLMLGTDPAATPERRNPVAGDIRLNITRVHGKTRALLYRPVAPGTTTPKVPFISPVSTLEFDRVDDVSAAVTLAGNGKGDYEIAVSLETLGLRPAPGMRIRGDIGLIRGDGNVNVARTYWSNKATGIVSDEPSEARLVPALWGVLHFED